jgi:hypothetical protein
VEYQFATVERVYAALTRSGGPDPLLLLGAGASIKSGIPLSGALAERAAKWAYCRSNARHPDDPTVKRSDWFPWLERHLWYRSDRLPADNYSLVLEHLLQPREERKDFLLGITHPDVPASPGYQHLVEFMAQHVVRTVLTTNFDSVLPDLCRARNRPHHVEVIKTPDDLTKFSTSPAYPQIIYLHGSVEHYSDKNLIDEVQRLNDDVVTHIFPLLRDHPLIVVGYRGAEPSIMGHLLLEHATAANLYRHGIFWCATQATISAGLNVLVDELAQAIGGNLQVVPIDGFDELFGELLSLYERRPPLPVGSEMASSASVIPPTYDMTPMPGATLDELDWARVRQHLIEYCRRLAVAVPTPVTREWLTARLEEYDLARRHDGQLVPTIAGYLLFARQPATRVRAAQVGLRVGGEDERTFDGSLWNQLEQAMEALEEVNRPFRLKGAVSETVYPYPPLALKELVVNALAHRSYEQAQRVLIAVEPMYIRIANPGGLVEDVVRSVAPEALQSEIAGGKRGIKGYRNPVIADLLYSAGAMDKAGSGLADVQSWVTQNEGAIAFGPIAENSAFDVTIYRRPEQVDSETGVAAPLRPTARYMSNLLEVLAWPDSVWSAPTPARAASDVWAGREQEPLPPFILADGRLYTFSDLTAPSNPLLGVIGGTPGVQATTTLLASADGARRFVRILNQYVYRHLSQCGLYVERKRQRAYFPRSEPGPQEVTYQARLRRATRTVTKPIISKVTQRVRYWEHEAVRFAFEQFGDTWALSLLPGYVFTVDGRHQLVAGPKVGPLATRRAARDYNPQVHNDLVFWLWVLARGAETLSLDAGSCPSVELRARFAACTVREVTPTPDADELDVVDDRGAQLAIEDELEALISRPYGDDGEPREGGIDDDDDD